MESPVITNSREKEIERLAKSDIDKYKKELNKYLQYGYNPACNCKQCIKIKELLAKYKDGKCRSVENYRNDRSDAGSYRGTGV